MIVTSTMIVQLCSKMAALSSNQAGFGTTDFLNLANLQLNVLTSELLASREEYLLFQDYIPVVPGTSSYRIPYRAVNGELRHIWYEDGTGARTRLEYKMVENIEDYNSTDSGSPSQFYVMADDVVLIPAPNKGGNLVFMYPFRPNQLVDGTTTQTIIGLTTNSVTLANMPTNFTSGATYDIIDHASGNGIQHYDKVGSVAGNVITFSDVIPNASVGNFIALANQSPVPMIPEEGHALLLETTIMRLEIIRGNPARIKNSSAVVADARKAWDLLLMNRIVSKAHPTGSGGQQFPMRPW